MSGHWAGSWPGGPAAIGRLLWLEVEDSRGPAEWERAVRRLQPGGIVVGDRCLRSAESAALMLSRIGRATRVPPVLSFAAERGTSLPFLPALPALTSAALEGRKAVNRLGGLFGEALRILGFNCCWLPVLDVAGPSFKSNFECETLSSDPRKVAQCGEAFVRGLRRHRVLACAGHFPGEGAAKGVPGEWLPLVDRSMAELWRHDLVPFRKLLPRLSLVLLSRAGYKAYDFDVHRPAAHSPAIVEGLLRAKLNFHGVAVADLRFKCFGRSISRRPDWREPRSVFVQALNAGCDVLVVESEIAFRAATKAIVRALEAGELSSRRLNQAVERIKIATRRIGRPSGKVPRAALERLGRLTEKFSGGIHPMERSLA